MMTLLKSRLVFLKLQQIEFSVSNHSHTQTFLGGHNWKQDYSHFVDDLEVEVSLLRSLASHFKTIYIQWLNKQF